MNAIRIKNDLLIEGPCCDYSSQKQDTHGYENQGIWGKKKVFFI